jgi:hypothetical protein
MLRPLSTSELLEVWERGLAEHPVERAHSLLAVACPGTPREELRRLTVGQRDACLFVLRGLTFGPQAVGLATCPDCSERHELVFPLADLGVIPAGKPDDVLEFAEGGIELSFRLPNSADLAAIGDQTDPTRARLRLFERCLLSVRRDGSGIAASELPDQIIDLVSERMGQADPQGDVEIALCCKSCNREWQEPFDILSFFWTEIHAWANKILMEVHSLASSYGWSEADILAMHPWRRHFYLEMAGR